MPESLLRGISLTLLATLGIVLMNTCAKMSSLTYGPIEMVFYRGFVALIILVPYMIMSRPIAVFKTRRSIIAGALRIQRHCLGDAVWLDPLERTPHVFGCHWNGHCHRQQHFYRLAGETGAIDSGIKQKRSPTVNHVA